MGGAAQVHEPAAKQRVRGPHVRMLVSRASGVPFETALVLAEEANGVIASNKRLDRALVTDQWRSVVSAFAAWTGTMTAYVKPGQKLGEKIEYVDPGTGHRWVFAVPSEHRDKSDAILVAEYPDYQLEVTGKDRIVHAARVDLIEGFPASGGRYLTDSVHGIPTTQEGDSAMGERYLWRIASRVGPVWRGFFFGVRRDVGLGEGPSNGLGVLIEAADTDERDSSRPPSGKVGGGAPLIDSS